MDRNLDVLLYELSQTPTVAVSGEALARDLGVSHSTLARWIEKLRAAGVEIHGEPFTGYRLERLPDILLPQLIRPRLRTHALGRTLYHFYRVDSTNAFVERLLNRGQGPPDGAVVFAEMQTAGRGRLDRSWHSAPEDGLYFSVILRPKIPASAAPLVTLMAAVAVHDAIERQSGVAVDIKWPNDLLVDGKKVCGILAQLRADADRVSSIVVGMGVNVNHAVFPGEIAHRATSLRLASGRTQSRLDIFVDVLEELERRLDAYEHLGPSSVTDAWSERSSFANGHRIRIDDGYRAVDGITRGLNRFGGIRIESPTGTIEDFYSGDIDHWS